MSILTVNDKWGVLLLDVTSLFIEQDGVLNKFDKWILIDDY